MTPAIWSRTIKNRIFAMPHVSDRLKPSRFLCLLLGLSSIAAAADRVPPLPDPCVGRPQDGGISAGEMRKLVEDDWLLSLKRPVTTQSDAAGACDGVKNGAYGFHTNQEPNPWWQVDLGEERVVGRMVVYNRLDYAPGLHNADTLQVFASADGKDWTLCHDNQGRHFGGITGAPPLEVGFGEQGLKTRFIRLVIPSPAPIFLHLDEVEVYAPGDDTTNIALGRSADQCSLSPWSTKKIDIQVKYPVTTYLDRARKEAARLRGQGVDVSQAVEELDSAAARLAGLSADAPEETLRVLYLDIRWSLRRMVLANPLLDFDQLLFVKRFTQETYPDVCLNHMPWVSKPGGDICVLKPATEGGALFSALAEPSPENPERPVATVRTLLNKALGPGHVHGLDLWFGGNRVVFGYARAKSENPPEGWLDRSQSYRLRREEEPIHLFELRLEDGSVRQLTSGEWSDLDPTYAPNGDIVFVSERCGTSLQCNEYDKDETSCNLYVMRPDGSGIRRLSANKDGDYLPHCLDNGMIAYTRWEYQERSWAFIQSIWVIRPDGTGADALFKQHFANPWALEEARSIPNSHKLVAIAAGHHTLPVGPLVTVEHGMGVNEPRGIGIVTPGLLPPEGGMDGVPVPEGGTDDQDGFYGTPWPLSEDSFLAAYTHGTKPGEPTGYGLYLVDVHGNKELLYRDPNISCFYPIPLRPRPVPPVLPDTTSMAATQATCYVSNIAQGSKDVPPETIRYLRIAEPIGWPYDNENGGQRYGEDHRYGGPGAERKNLTNWTPVRILGDVPVRADGSVHFRVPADTAVYFQLLDENRMELRRMRSFVSFQPGELRGCVGCHETRASAPASPVQKSAAALASKPDTLILPPWGDRPVSFLRDVQPVLDRHCTRCHAGLDPAGGLDFSGGLVSHDEEVAGYGHNRAFETMLANNLVALSPARMQDAGITPPFAYGARKSRLITALSDGKHAERVDLSEEDRLRLVMWADANAPYHDQFVNKRPERPAYDPAADRELLEALREVHGRRCASCHEIDKITRLDWVDLERPERSRFLTAPLAGSAWAGKRCGETVYPDRNDADYARVRSLVFDAAAKAWENPRRDLAALNRPAWSN
jgi:mono/diheme cytochrome c family protein